MTAFLRVSVLCVTLSALTIFTGCSKKSDNWLIGEWTFDAEATTANMPTNMKAEGVPDAVAKQMAAQLKNQLMAQMVNIKFNITADKITSISPAGEESSSYKIVKRPDANTIVVEAQKGQKGETTTFTRSGKNICMSTTGAVDFKMYLKPAN